MITYARIQMYASRFLEVADTHNASVSSYFDGSNASKDIDAYNIVKNAYKMFIDAYNTYYNENIDYELDYCLAESVLN